MIIIVAKLLQQGSCYLHRQQSDSSHVLQICLSDGKENKQTILHLIKVNATCTAANFISANHFALIERQVLGDELVRTPLKVFMPLSHFICAHFSFALDALMSFLCWDIHSVYHNYRCEPFSDDEKRSAME